MSLFSTIIQWSILIFIVVVLAKEVLKMLKKDKRTLKFSDLFEED